MKSVRKPSNPNAKSAGVGTIIFLIGADGALRDRFVEANSGDGALDKAVFDAIAVAAPYPAPPGGKSTRLRFTYNVGDKKPAQ